jgi:hypothetical protein
VEQEETEGTEEANYVPEWVARPDKGVVTYSVRSNGTMRHWPKFKCWTWGVVLIAVTVAVCIRNECHRNREKEVLAQLVPRNFMVGFRPIGPRWLDSRLPQVGWTRRWCGIRAIGLNDATNDDLETLRRLPSLEELLLEETTLTAPHVETLKRLTSIKVLRLLNTPITDSQFEQLVESNPDLELTVSIDVASPSTPVESRPDGEPSKANVVP